MDIDRRLREAAVVARKGTHGHVPRLLTPSAFVRAAHVRARQRRTLRLLGGLAAIVTVAWLYAPVRVSTPVQQPELPSDAPASTASYPSTAVDGIVCPNLVTAFDNDIPGIDDGTLQDRLSERDRLSNDMRIIVTYAQRHAGDIAFVGWSRSSRVRILVAVTGNIDEHCQQLLDLVDDADGFLIAVDDRSGSDLTALLAEVQEMAGERQIAAWVADPFVRVHIPAYDAELARTLYLRYGPRLQVQLGAMPFPDPTAEGWPDCPASIDVRGDTRGLVYELKLNEASVPSGREFTGGLSIGNPDSTESHLMSDMTLRARVYEPDGTEPVATFTGLLPDPGRQTIVEPGETEHLDVVGTTASCAPALGYALPPGTYDVRVNLEYGPDPAAELLVE
jgi:hypothetical protein